MRFAQIFDENPPETLTEVNDDENFAVSKWIQGYADIWPDMWSAAVENRATATLNITRIGGSGILQEIELFLRPCKTQK